jgi:7-keto-8-aminopelargonate synthetase-like enzyme
MAAQNVADVWSRHAIGARPRPHSPRLIARGSKQRADIINRQDGVAFCAHGGYVSGRSTQVNHCKEHPMHRLILAAALIVPVAAHAQSAQFCISPALAQTLAGALAQDKAVLDQLNEAAQEPARQAAAIAAAREAQKAEDGKSHASAPNPASPPAPATGVPPVQHSP